MFGEALALVLLAAVLVAAVVRPHGLPEVLVAGPAALLLLASGVLTPGQAADEATSLWPVLVFLAAVLVLARLCAVEGLFAAAGNWLAGRSTSGDRLLIAVFALSAAVTCVLSLDATVVLLTPVVLATAGRLGLPARPYVYASGHLANSGSLLLPMGNLTNLLALAASGLTLAHFAGLMLLPWVVVLAVEYVVFRTFFRSDLAVDPAPVDDGQPSIETPRFAVGVLVVTLAGFVATSFVGVAPYWVAIGACVVLGTHALANGLVAVTAIAGAVDLPFLCFVMALALVVRAAVERGLGGWVDHLVPGSSSLGALLAAAVVAAVLANAVNNLPALLVLMTPAAAVGPVMLLAILIGVNVGPNLTYPGSLATLLWRRVLAGHGLTPSLRTFTTLGALTVPVGLVLAVVGLWLTAHI